MLEEYLHRRKDEKEFREAMLTTDQGKAMLEDYNARKDGEAKRFRQAIFTAMMLGAYSGLIWALCMYG